MSKNLLSRIGEFVNENFGEKMKINKKLLNLALLSAFVLVLIGFVNSATLSEDNITIATPAASGIMTGTAVFNCSITDGYQEENWTRVRISFQSASLTANTTETAFSGWTLNTTDLDLNGTIDTTIVEDSNDYTFKCQIWNGTNYLNKTRSSITIENTIPQAPTSLVPTSSTSKTVNFSSTVTAENTTSCTLFFQGINPGNPNYAMSHGGTTCSYNIATVPEQTYVWYVRASDGTNTTDSGTQTTSVDISTGGTGAAYLASKGKIKPTGDGTFSIVSKDSIKSVPAFVWIILAIIVVLVIYNIKKR